MKRLAILVIFIGVFLIYLSACQQGEGALPREVEAGVDKCAVCSMEVPHDHNATQIVTDDGEHQLFDDIGCMNIYLEDNNSVDTSNAFVRDYDTKEWINYNDATYAYDKTFKTPMGYGILSFVDKGDAEAFIKEQGKGQVISSEGLESHSWARVKPKMNMDMK